MSDKSVSVDPAARERTSRRERIKGRNVRLKERDVDILLALAKMRLLRTSDLARLYFGAVGTAQKRLRKLYDAGLVRAVVLDLAAENRYALTRLGHALLEEALEGEEAPPFRRMPRIDGRSLGHLDLLNRYRIALATSASEVGVELRSFLPEWELRAKEPLAELVPDALVALTHEGRVVELALEVDTASEPPQTVVRKIERYATAKLTKRSVCGARSPIPFVITTTPRRARSLARALREVRATLFLLGSAPFLLDDGGLTKGLADRATLVDVSGPLGAGDFVFGLVDRIQAQVNVGGAMSPIRSAAEVAEPARVAGARLRAAVGMGGNARS
jgi:hypothetical protein